MKIILIYIFLLGLIHSSYSQGLIADINELPKSFPTPWEKALGTFEIHPEFEIELVAHEPEVIDPIAMTFDNLGRMYVIEMRGYSERRNEMLGRVKMLEDKDNDGHYEVSHIFADQLKWPTAIIWWNGGIFLAATPDIYWMKDQDGDGRMDIKRKIFTGFGSNKNRLNVQALVNSFRWGVDNRIHGATAGNGGTIQKIGSPNLKPLNLYNRDFSFDPRTLDIRIENVTAQYGLSFDKWGRKFTCSNSDHIQTIIHHWHNFSSKKSIAVDGAAAEVYRISEDEPWRKVRTRWRIAGAVPGPIEGGGRVSGYFTSATGLTIYKGNNYDRKWNGTAFVADAGSNLIHVKQISRIGNHVSAARPSGLENKEFIASTDNWFRPVQFENGPDGCIYLADMYRETIEHPWSLPPGIKNFLDLNSGKDHGRIYRIKPKISTSQKTSITGRLTNGELIELLAEKNYWTRATATKILLSRDKDQISSLLKQKVQHPDHYFGNLNELLHILMVKNSLELLEAQELIQIAERISATKPNEWDTFIATLLNYFVSPSSHLSDKDKQDFLNHLFKELTKSSLDKFNKLEFQIPLIYGLGQFDSELDKLILLLPYSNLESKWIIEAYSNIFEPAPNVVAPKIINSLNNFPKKKSDEVISIIERLGKKAAPLLKIDDDYISLFKKIEEKDNILFISFLSGLLEASQNQLPDFVDGLKDAYNFASSSIDPLPDKLNESNKSIIRFLALHNNPEAFTNVIRRCLSQNTSDDLTEFVIYSASLRNDEEVFGILMTAFSDLNPGQKLAASRALSGKNFEIKLLQSLSQSNTHEILKYLSSHQLNQWLNSSNTKVKSLAQKAFGKSASEKKSDRQKVINEYLGSLSIDSSPLIGKRIFEVQCAICHSMSDKENNLAPSLSSLRSMGAEKLLVHILDPNKEIAPRYLPSFIETLDGEILHGIISEASSESVTVKLPQSTEVRLDRSDITKISPLRESIMPANFETSIDDEQMANLISYISGN